jgi:acyl carrier protein
MTKTQILEGVRSVLREHLRISRPVYPETDLFRDLELDSLKQLTLVVELENYFRICFDEGDEEGLRTIGDVMGLISRRIEDVGTKGSLRDV